MGSHTINLLIINKFNKTALRTKYNIYFKGFKLANIFLLEKIPYTCYFYNQVIHNEKARQ